MEKITHCINHNRFIPVDTEELTALELIGKTVEKSNELVDKSNNHEDRITENEKKKVSFDDMKNKYKHNDSDFVGSWHGIERPEYAEPGIAGVVASHTEKFLQDDTESGYLSKFKRETNESDTDYLNRFFAFMNEKKVLNINLDGGSYVIKPTGINIFSNQNINLNGSTITVESNNQDSYNIFRMEKLVNIIIENGTLVGDRKNHIGTTGEWGMGIRMGQCENITLNNLLVKDFWGDAIYVGSSENTGYSKNISLNNIICENNRRQGLSVISVDGLYVSNCEFNNTNGVAPQCGIDFEPNYSTHRLKNIKLVNVVTNYNVGGGILCYLGQLNETTESVDITLINHSGKGSSLFYCNANPMYPIKGLVTNNTPTYIVERNTAITLNKTINFPFVNIVSPTIIIDKDYPSTSVSFANAISCILETTSLDTDILGGFSINSPTIICGDNTPQAFKNILYCINKKNGDQLKDISLINPNFIGNIERLTGLADLNIGTELPLNSNIQIRDNGRMFIRERSNFGTLKTMLYSVYILSNSTADRVVNLNNMPPNTEILFINKDVTGWKMTLNATDIDGQSSLIVPQNKKALLKNIGSGKWTVISQ